MEINKDYPYCKKVLEYIKKYIINPLIKGTNEI